MKKKKKNKEKKKKDSLKKGKKAISDSELSEISISSDRKFTIDDNINSSEIQSISSKFSNQKNATMQKTDISLISSENQIKKRKKLKQHTKNNRK